MLQDVAAPAVAIEVLRACLCIQRVHVHTGVHLGLPTTLLIWNVEVGHYSFYTGFLRNCEYRP